MEKRKIVLFFHGFKKKGYVEFANFFEYAKEKVKYEMVSESNWYENHEKSTLHHKKFHRRMSEIIDSYKDEEIIIIGYSAGAIGALSMAAKYDNIKSVLAMYPSYYINFRGWVKVLLSNVKKWKKMKKTFGKERYKRMKELKNKGASEKYPIRLSIHINLFRKYQIKNLYKIKGKRIEIIWSHSDEITQVNKTLNLLRNSIDKTKNNYTLSEKGTSHWSALDKGQDKTFDDIINFINNS